MVSHKGTLGQECNCIGNAMTSIIQVFYSWINNKVLVKKHEFEMIRKTIVEPFCFIAWAPIHSASDWRWNSTCRHVFCHTTNIKPMRFLVDEKSSLLDTQRSITLRPSNPGSLSSFACKWPSSHVMTPITICTFYINDHVE